jgi:glutaredoxin 3
VSDVAGQVAPASFTGMKAQRIRLFIKPYCGWCHQAMDWLNDRDITYERLDVTADTKVLQEMQKLSGQSLAPVIEVDGQILADFDTGQLKEFWRQFEEKPAT